MADTTGRFPLWIIGTVAGILVIGLVIRYLFHRRQYANIGTDST